MFALKPGGVIAWGPPRCPGPSPEQQAQGSGQDSLKSRTLRCHGLWSHSVSPGCTYTPEVRMCLQFSSVAQSCLTPFKPMAAAHLAPLSITNSQSLLKLMSIESVIPSTISFSVVHFSSCLQSFPASGSFTTSQFFESSGQSPGASASASVLPMNIQD